MTLTHCIADGCGAEFDSSIPDNRPNLRSFWQRYCQRCRTLGNAGTPAITGIPAKPTHYIAMSGAHGCLPDSCNAYETYQAAVDELAELFELGRTRKARLFADRYLELRNDDGAQYCEITACQCEKPWEHCDAGDDPRDWSEYKSNNEVL